MATASVLHLPFSITATPPPLRPLRTQPVRRQPAPAQGRGLSTLGHAIEYLIDSRIVEGGTDRNDNEAVRILMGCSRTLFEECALRKPLPERLGPVDRGAHSCRQRGGNDLTVNPSAKLIMQ